MILTGEAMLVSMGFFSWYRRFFPAPGRSATLETTRAAAEGGDVDAQFALGVRYCTGDGQDLPLAARWYQKAAEQDHSLAQLNLGRMLTEGEGVARDQVAALTWFRRAAERGDAGAQFVLGAKFQRLSLERNRSDRAESRVEAYKWLHLAAEQGYMGAAYACEQVNLSMTTAEVFDGNQRVAAFAIRVPVQWPAVGAVSAQA